MRLIMCFICLLPFLLAGQNEKVNDKENSADNDLQFDKAKWQTKDGSAYPYRELK